MSDKSLSQWHMFHKRIDGYNIEYVRPKNKWHDHENEILEKDYVYKCKPFENH